MKNAKSLNAPKVSVIIAVYNGMAHIEETIESILSQTYNKLELIIIDGGSTDGTLDVIEKYKSSIDYFVSEKDKGISDAFNKGVAVATGDYINFQGDGDGFWQDNALEKAMSGVDKEKDILVSCKIARVSDDDKVLYFSKHMKHFSKRSLLLRMSLPHQGLFTHREFFKQYGMFDVNNTFCMDYEHLLRGFHDFPRVKMQNVTLARWRADGLGNNRELEIYKEYDAIKRKHKVASDWVLTFVNYWILFKYQLKKLIKL